MLHIKHLIIININISASLQRCFILILIFIINFIILIFKLRVLMFQLLRSHFILIFMYMTIKVSAFTKSFYINIHDYEY